MAKIKRVLVLGGGSAGWIAALTLAKKVPGVKVRVVRSPDIGVIGVGEGTTAAFPRHFFKYLGISGRDFYKQVQPTWKLGVRFLWGERDEFFYGFGNEYERPVDGLQRMPGFYFDDDSQWLGAHSALMSKGKVFPQKQGGTPDMTTSHAFHIENEKLVDFLENAAREAGVEVTDGKVTQVITGPVYLAGREAKGVHSLILESGETLSADLFIDASGFRSELLSGALELPRVDYGKSLFCDRAVIGGWSREDEPIPAYTTAETMDSGWAWQIEHRHWINRGYVFSSNFASDDEAEAEFRGKNPKLGDTRLVKFLSYRTDRMWAGNVVGIGNASGFVEPLEATALQVICVQSSTLADCLSDSLLEPTPSLIDHYNQYNIRQWDDVRDFLAVHYRFNTRCDSPFWQACRADVDLGGAEEIVQTYRENGPSVLLAGMVFHPSNSFGYEGYLSMLVGQKVPHEKPYAPSDADKQAWLNRYRQLEQMADGAMDSHQAFAFFEKVGWL